VILHGSLTLGDYVPGRSDLDLLVVAQDPLTDAQLAAAPAELIGEVPDRWVLAAGDAQLADWQAIGDDPPYAELMVLAGELVAGRFGRAAPADGRLIRSAAPKR
jgi:predicted nucleotidyltransferase